MIAAVAVTLRAADPLAITARARSFQPGELVVLTITGAEGSAPPRVRVFDRDESAFAGDGRTWRALAGIDLDTRPGRYTAVATAADGRRAAFEIVVAPHRFPTRKLTVDPAFVTPPPSARERIEGDNRLLAETWRSSARERLWTTPFVRPVPQEANSAFGTRSVFNGAARNPHGGADFLSPAGEPVHAPNAGRVLVARDLYFSGNTIVIDHGLGLFSLLAHLSAFDVKEGDRVAAGQLVGRVGATGRVTGPHLHWAVRVNGARVDPLSLLALLGDR